MVLPSNNAMLISTEIFLLHMSQTNPFSSTSAVNYPDPELFLYNFCLHIMKFQVYMYIFFLQLIAG